MKKLAILVSRGEHNNLVQAATLMMTAVVSNVAVRVLFRDEAVLKVTKDRIGQFNFSAALAAQAPQVIARLKANRLDNVAQLFRDLKTQGDVRLAVCSSSMDLCGVAKDQLIPEVDEIRGLTSFLTEEMATADVVVTL